MKANIWKKLRKAAGPGLAAMMLLCNSGMALAGELPQEEVNEVRTEGAALEEGAVSNTELPAEGAAQAETAPAAPEADAAPAASEAPAEGAESQDIYVVEAKGNDLVLTGLTEYGKTLEHIDIPQGVTVIGKDAFAGHLDESHGGTNTLSNVKTVSIPNSVKQIEVGAFAVSGLTEVVIPDSVTSIGTNCFQGSENLGKVTLSKNLTAIPEAAFAETAIAEISLPEGITSIGVFSFGACRNLTSVTFPESIESLAEAAFVGCAGLKSVEFKYNSRIENIHPAAFAGCQLETVKIQSDKEDVVGDAWSGDTQITWVNYGQSTDALIIMPKDGEVVLTGLTAYGKTLEHIDIPQGVTVIGKDAFAGHLDESHGGTNTLSNVKTVSIPNSVKQIEVGAFAVSGLTEVVIPDSVTSIGTNCFQGSENLGKVTLSKNLTAIPEAAFAETAIAEISLPEGITSIGVFSFGSCRNLTSVTFPTSIKSIDEAAFVACAGLKNVEFKYDSRIERIHPAAFAGCRLDSIKIQLDKKEVVGEAWGGETRITWVDYSQKPSDTQKPADNQKPADTKKPVSPKTGEEASAFPAAMAVVLLGVCGIFAVAAYRRFPKA